MVVFQLLVVESVLSLPLPLPRVDEGALCSGIVSKLSLATNREGIEEEEELEDVDGSQIFHDSQMTVE